MSIGLKVDESEPRADQQRVARDASRYREVSRGRAKQSAKDECDINVIVARHQSLGTFRNLFRVSAADLVQRGVNFGFAPSFDFREAVSQVLAAEATFAELPSAVRARFRNNPAEFLDFMADTRNVDEAVKLGLVVKRPAAPGASPPVAQPASGSGGNPQQ